MIFTSRTRTLQYLSKALSKDTIKLDHALQREEGQWNTRLKAELIDSILRKYPINPIYAIKEDETLSVIDGVQRLSTIRDYIADKFAMVKDMDDIVIGDQVVNISGKKFSKLDENVQDAINSAELQVYELTDCTERDVKELFRRQNAGKPLNSRQLRVVFESNEFNQVVYSLANHPFMNKIMTKTQYKNGTCRDVIIQTFMLICTTQDNDFTSFRTKDINHFIMLNEETALSKVNTLKEGMDKLNAAFANMELTVPSTSLPQILYSAYRVVKDKKSFQKLTDIIVEFLNTYDSNDEYKQYVQSGTGSSENVRGRFDYWRNKLREL